MSEWRQTTLGHCFDLVTARTDPATVDPGMPYVGMEHLDPYSPRIIRSGSPSKVSSAVSFYEVGDVLFGRLRPYLHKVALAESRGVCSPEILVLRPTSATTQGFAYLLAASEPCIDHAVKNSAGSRMPRVSGVDLANFPVALPSHDVQRQVTSVITAADSQIEVLQHELSTINHLVAKIAEGNSPTRRFPSRPLGKQICARGGKRMPRGVPFAEAPTTHPYLRVVDMENLGFRRSKLEFVPDKIWPSIARYTVNAGDLVISIVGTIGRVAIVPDWAEGANLTENAAVIDVLDAGIDREWLAAWLTSSPGQHEIKRVTVGTSQGKLALSRIPLIEAPDIPRDEQERQGLISRAASTVVVRMTAELATLRTFRSELLSALLSQSITIPEAYNALLDVVPAGAQPGDVVA